MFFPPVSYSAVPLQSIDCFCSSRRLIASLLARFALVRRRNCSCSYSRQFRFSPSIVYALLLARSASVRRLFLLFLSIKSFSSRPFRSSPSIVSAILVARSASVRRLLLLFKSPVPLQSIDCLCYSRLLIASLLASFALVRRLLLLFSLMDLGRVRRKMMRKNCERINAIKTVTVFNPFTADFIQQF